MIIMAHKRSITSSEMSTIDLLDVSNPSRARQDHYGNKIAMVLET